MYDDGRYLTINGNPGPGASRHFAERQAELDAWHAELFPAEPPAARPAAPPPPPSDLDDAALLEKAFAAKGGEDFRRQHEGQYLGEDKSADDFAYLGRLRFWAQGDHARLRRIALVSGRVRDKWHTRRGNGDWLDYSIGKALAEPHEVYNPATYHQSPRPAPATADAGDDPALLRAQLAARDNLIATLTADVKHLGDRLRYEQEAGERAVLHITHLEDEVRMLKAVIKHPDQTASVSALDLDAGADRAYERGQVLTKDGKDWARVTFEAAADCRSDSTLARGFARLKAAGTLEAFTRDELIPTPQGDKLRPIAYIYKPPELRGQRGKGVLALLPAAGEKQHGGRRTIPVPPAVAAQEHPVRRKRTYRTEWSDALTDEPITTQTTLLGTDYWTNQGGQLLPDEIRQQRVALGYEPPRAPAPGPQALRLFPLPQVEEGGCNDGSYPQVEDIPINDPYPQVEEGGCNYPGCGLAATLGGYCAAHFSLHARRHAATWGYAHAGGDD